MKKLSILFGLALAVSGIQTASATSFSGTFADDSDVQFFTFDLTGPAHLLVNSSSFSTGGFWPQVGIWLPDGTAAGGVGSVNPGDIVGGF